jgi:hypothetical protein
VGGGIYSKIDSHLLDDTRIPTKTLFQQVINPTEQTSFTPISQRSEISSSPIHDKNKSTPKQVNFSDNTDFLKPVPKSTMKPKPRRVKVSKNIYTSDTSGTEDDEFGIDGNLNLQSLKPRFSEQSNNINKYFQPVDISRNTTAEKSFKNPKQVDTPNKTENLLPTDKALVQSTSSPLSPFADFFSEPEPNSYLVTPQHKPSNNLEDDNQVNFSYVSDVTGPSDISSIDNDSLPPPPPPPRDLQRTKVVEPKSVIRYKQKHLKTLMTVPEFVENLKDKHELVEKKVIGGKKGEMEMVLVYKKSKRKVPDETIDRYYNLYK